MTFMARPYHSASFFSFLLLSFALFDSTSGQSSDQASPDARTLQLQSRFKQGILLENQGKLPEALSVFEGIIHDEPKAPGSLFYSALVLLELGRPEESLDFIDKFRALQPHDFKGIVLSIQANQALRRTVKIEGLRDELFALRKSANVPGLTDSKCYTRERIFGDKGGVININEFFDYREEPHFLYMGEQKNADGDTVRRLLVFFNTDETASARAKNAKFADVEVFNFSEEVIKDGKPAQINIYRMEYEKPSYDSARKWILDAIQEPPKPLLISPIN